MPSGDGKRLLLTKKYNKCYSCYRCSILYTTLIFQQNHLYSWLNNLQNVFNPMVIVIKDDIKIRQVIEADEVKVIESLYL